MTAYERLADAVVRAKDGKPLSLVTVIVPSFGAARDVLRYLARRDGVANTRVLTVAQAVDYLAAPALAPRTALPYPLLEAAVQRILADEPGEFVDVADQSITSRALAGASLALCSLAHPAMSDPTPLVADMLRVHQAVVDSQRSRYFLAHEAYAAATSRIGKLGSVIVFQPVPANDAESQFLSALQRAGETVDVTDDATGTIVVHASDADDEVRAIVRLIRSHLASGVPGHRIGVFYGGEDPYLHLIHEHFANAGFEIAGPQTHSLIDRPAARSLLRLLALDPEQMPRRELLAILAERSVRCADSSGNKLSQHKIERLTRRECPIVGGSDWLLLDEIPTEHASYPTAQGLHDFVRTLAKDLRGLGAVSDWAEASERLVAIIDRYFVERPDVTTLRRMASELTHMDGVAPDPTIRAISEAMTVRIEASSGSVGTFGAGISFGPISAGVGRDLDVSIILGAAEGIVPAPHREDPLLPGRLTGWALADDIRLQHRRLQLTLGSGRERVLAFPRGSLRGGAEKVPSRWVMPTLERLAGRPVGITSWHQDTQAADTIVAVESFDAAVQKPDLRLGITPATGTEWRMRALAQLSADKRQGRLDDAIIRLGMRLRSDRLNGRFTRFNGNVSDAEDLITFFTSPVSPTRLEEWLTCPYLFFVRRILRADCLPDPDTATAVDALTRGNLVHKILELFVIECIGGQRRSLSRLLEHADDVLRSARLAAPGWLPQLWEKDSEIIRRDLVEWFACDNDDHDDGWSPDSAERGFDDVEIDLGDTAVRFTGKVDRIDRHHDGRIRVTDYKTGKANSYKDQTLANPTGSGRKLQLPVYGLFARSLGGAQVEARYWFISSKAKWEIVGYTVTDAVIDVLRKDVTIVHRMINAGYFPPMPPDNEWPDDLLGLIGRPGLERAWGALEHVPELADLVATRNGGAHAD
ncbi:PD-(D/E)XK nuclease family protein [Skermania sp. ID1734]|uniref:PD-(D/E)XK nuclease family protein n=1 Tax=Skermania sp. ID1734 TaxID=2597516 RepID=UPI00117E7071|nr:PD-(D/E)XK nuclease family protein [Skermania sp. ID1734]TSE01828.1 PD-(D/E)XK nuclease family protein [Skermania sp. ID1734]